MKAWIFGVEGRGPATRICPRHLRTAWPMPLPEGQWHQWWRIGHISCCRSSHNHCAKGPTPPQPEDISVSHRSQNPWNACEDEPSPIIIRVVRHYDKGRVIKDSNKIKPYNETSVWDVAIPSSTNKSLSFAIDLLIARTHTLIWTLNCSGGQNLNDHDFFQTCPSHAVFRISCSIDNGTNPTQGTCPMCCTAVALCFRAISWTYKGITKPHSRQCFLLWSTAWCKFHADEAPCDWLLQWQIGQNDINHNDKIYKIILLIWILRSVLIDICDDQFLTLPNQTQHQSVCTNKNITTTSQPNNGLTRCHLAGVDFI